MQKFILAFLAVLVISQQVALAHDHSHDHGHVHGAEETPEELKYVTCGSVIKLQHKETGFYLHSHEVNYGSGSKQQSVTGYPEEGDPNSYWKVKAPHGKECAAGERIANKALFRLEHLATHRNLHSHDVKSPMTNGKEISAYGNGGDGDSLDNFKLVTTLGKKFWMRGENVLLYHPDTRTYVRTMQQARYNHPIAGQLEIAGHHKDGNSEWRTGAGIYFPADLDE